LERISALWVWRNRTGPVHTPRRARRIFRIDAAPTDTNGSASRSVPSRVICYLILLGLIAASVAWMITPPRLTLSRRPGQIVPNFTLVDARTGQLNRLADYRGRCLVVVFVGTSCPVGDLYMPRLCELAQAYEPRNVDFLAINSNASESIEEVGDYARRSRAFFPVLKDDENRVADQLLVERTCEALVIDGEGRLRYRGAIDDQYGLGSRRDRPVRHYLRDAIDATLAGRKIDPEITTVVGCPIERKVPQQARPQTARRTAPATKGAVASEDQSAGPAALTDRPVTYAGDVAAILHARCASCHRQGQVAPFSLLTYADARRWSASITEVVTDGRMPPWHADPRYGHFANDRSLSQRERKALLTWVEEGCPPGDLATAPAPPSRPQGWSIGTPDLIFELPETFEVPAQGSVAVQHYRVPTHLKDDIWIQAAEARPSDRGVIHHIFVYTEKYRNTITRQKDKIFLAAYLPGDVLAVYPPGVAKKVPAGSDLVFEVHYTPIGKVRYDRSSVGFIVSKAPPRHVAVTRGLAARGLKIPPGVSDHVERADWKILWDIRLLSLSPHMHLRGKSFRYEARYPDGKVEVLLSVPNYDFGWQSVYRFVEPKFLPRGTTIYCEAHYDNSTGNIANPDPGSTVVWGEQTWEEMMMGYLDYYKDEPGEPTSTAQLGKR
jgi:peroxiredoxin/mono/diheme cytochrome c family protein